MTNGPYNSENGGLTERVSISAIQEPLMRRWILNAVAYLVVSAPLCSQQVLTPTVGAKPLSPLEQELVNQVKQLDMAERHHDVNYVNRTYTPDFVAISAEGTSSDKSDVLTDMHAENLKEARATESHSKVWIYDFQFVPLNADAVIVAYKVADQSDLRYTHVSTVWVKQDGQWKLKFRQASPNRWSADDI